MVRKGLVDFKKFTPKKFTFFSPFSFKTVLVLKTIELLLVNNCSICSYLSITAETHENEVDEQEKTLYYLSHQKKKKTLPTFS